MYGEGRVTKCVQKPAPCLESRGELWGETDPDSRSRRALSRLHNPRPGAGLAGADFTCLGVMREGPRYDLVWARLIMLIHVWFYATSINTAP